MDIFPNIPGKVKLKSDCSTKKVNFFCLFLKKKHFKTKIPLVNWSYYITFDLCTHVT